MRDLRKFYLFSIFLISIFTAFSSSVFAQPEFKDGLLVIGSSNTHYPASSSNTIDTVAAIWVARAFSSLYSSYRLCSSYLDTDVAYWNGNSIVLRDWNVVGRGLYACAPVSSGGSTLTIGNFVKSTNSTSSNPNIIAVGGPLVNYGWYWLNSRAPIYFNPNNNWCLTPRSVNSSTYCSSGEYGKGTKVIDYAIITRVLDQSKNRWVGGIAGITGYSTQAAGIYFSRSLYENVNLLNYDVVILKITDNEGDGWADNVDISYKSPVTTVTVPPTNIA